MLNQIIIEVVVLYIKRGLEKTKFICHLYRRACIEKKNTLRPSDKALAIKMMLGSNIIFSLDSRI